MKKRSGWQVWSPRSSLYDQDEQTDGLVTLEDIQGNIELVLFPKTWQKTREQLTSVRSLSWKAK
jgi:DNA polymerase III alpha subunit